MISVCILFTACKKTDDSPTQEETRAADATFNNSITPGVGNVFYEEKLVPNTTSQLVFKMAYNQDTLAAYGKINNSGQLEYIHTTVLAKKGNSELLVTETFPEVSTSRMYAIINNVKSNMVVEIEHYSNAKATVSVIDLNWATGEKKVLKSTYISDGQAIADFTGLRQMGNERVWNCDQPQPSESLDQTVNNHLDYHACGGTAWDSHPSLAAIKEAITSSIDAIKSAGGYGDELSELNFLKSAHEKLSSLYAAIKGKVDNYKFERSILGGLLKQLEQRINELLESIYNVELTVDENGTDWSYDEVTDDEIMITLTLMDKNTNSPYIKAPVFVDLALVVPGTNDAVYMETKATATTDGRVRFTFDPTQLPDYRKYTSLEARFGLSSDNWQKTESQNVTLGFIKPKIVFASGAEIFGTVSFNNNETKNFKLVNEDNRPINADYTAVTLNNSNSKVGYTLLKGTSDFSLRLYTDEPETQETNLEVIYKDYKLPLIRASVMDSVEIYKAAAVGRWTMTWHSGQIDKFEFRADGTGAYYWMQPSGSSEGINIGPGNAVYRINWGISRMNGTYYLQISYPDRGWASSALIFLTPNVRCGVTDPNESYFLGVKD